jgi:type IV pilus assembly protein PilB
MAAEEETRASTPPEGSHGTDQEAAPEPPKSLGELLVEGGIITGEEMENVLLHQRERGGEFADILIDRGMVNQEQLAMVRSIQLNVPLIDLNRHRIQAVALKLVPEDLARRHTLIPVDVVADSLVVAMKDPSDIQAIEDVRATAGMNVESALAIASDIERVIELSYRSSGELERSVSQLATAPAPDQDTMTELIARTPIAQTLDLLISQAVKDRASDIHLEPQDDRLRVRFRVDGILNDVFALPLNAHPQIVSRIKIMAEMNITEQRRPQDGQFSVRYEDKMIDVRAATINTPLGEKVTLRILDKSLSLFSMEELGFQPVVNQRYRAGLESPFGLILVGGPTGSGKTTTLYASINTMDRVERNIMTIEDPIEYRFKDINQTQINPKAGLTFASGLRAIMRHDPDIILVGEIRDKDTATAAIQAALTGHLVLSSVHANDAVGVLFRMLDLGVEPYLVAATLVAVISQRMVRKICPNCQMPYEPSPAEREFIKAEFDEPDAKIYTGAGCPICDASGYQGRTGIYEMMLMSEGIRNLLHADANVGDIRAKALEEGMTTLKSDGVRKVLDGVTTIKEIQSKVFSVNL